MTRVTRSTTVAVGLLIGMLSVAALATAAATARGALKGRCIGRHDAGQHRIRWPLRVCEAELRDGAPWRRPAGSSLAETYRGPTTIRELSATS